MTLWILRPKDGNSDPWSPWYDKMFGVIVRAESEKRAREMAAEEAGDEGTEAWLDANVSSCKPLTADGDESVVLRDFHAA